MPHPSTLPKQIGEIPLYPEVFMEREGMLEAIYRELSKPLPEENKTSYAPFVLQAKSGMGKTTIAAKYYYDYADRYAHTIWLTKHGTIDETLQLLASYLNIVIDFKKGIFEQMAQILQPLNQLSKPVLIVIDQLAKNGNLIFNAYGLHYVPNIHFICIIDIPHRGTQRMKITPLSPKTSKQLFLHHCKVYDPKEEELLLELLDAVGHLPLSVELLAKHFNTAQSEVYTLKTLLFKLRKLKVLPENYAHTALHLVTPQPTPPEKIAQALYLIAPPTEAERKLLSLFALVDGLTLSFDMLQTISPLPKEENTQVLSVLVAKGWIQYDKVQLHYAMHPTIATIIRKKQQQTLYEDAVHFIAKANETIEAQALNDTTVLFANYAQRLLAYLRTPTYALAMLAKRVADFHQTQGRHATALGYYNTYVDLFESFYFNSDDESRYETQMKQAHHTLAEVYRAYAHKHNYIRQCKRKKWLSYKDGENFLAEFYIKIAKLYAHAEEYKSALCHALQAKQCFENYLKQEPENLAQRDELARLYGDIALYYHKAGKDQKALTYYYKEIECDKMLCDAAPEEPLYQERLTFAYKGLAHQYEAMGELEQAIHYQEKRAETMQVWCDMASFGDKIKHWVPYIYQEIGALYEKLGQREEALEAYERAVKRSEAFFASSKSEHFRDELAENYEKLATVYRRYGQKEKAFENNAKRAKLFKDTSDPNI